MKKLIALSLAVIFVLGVIGCGKEKDKPSDADQIGDKFSTNEWFTSIGETSKSNISGQTPITYGSSKCSGWNFIGDGVWKRVGSDSSEWHINIPSPGHANIPINLWWYDTLFVVYDSAGIKDTVAKPAPVFRASITFYYKNTTGTWEFEGLTPAEAKSDSAHPYVKIDSIKVENLTNTALTYPTLKDPTTTELFAGDSYPYTFHKNDLVKVKVFESGIDTTRWMLIFAPAPDTIPGWFGYNANLQCWEGTWQVRVLGCHWCWMDEIALSTILDKNITHEREMLWGLPYKVIE